MNKENKWRNLAQKNSSGEGDLDEKFTTIYLIKELFGLHGLTGETVEIPGNTYPNFPDIFIKDSLGANIAIDLHGDAPFHVDSKRDHERINEYSRTSVRYIVIYEVLTDGYSKEWIRKVLIEEFEKIGIKPI